MADGTLVERVQEKRQNGVMEIEQRALERDVCEAQERATGLQVMWQNCKNDLVAARLDAASAKRQLTSERTKLRQAKDQVTDLLSKMSTNEQLLKTLQRDLKQSQAKVLEMKEIILSKDVQITVTNTEMISVRQQLMDQKSEIDKLKWAYEEKCSEILDVDGEVKALKEQLEIAKERLNSWPYCILSWSRIYGAHLEVVSKIANVTNKLTSFPLKMARKVLKLLF